MPNEINVTRKLRAILSADVKGYSLLMADDEVHTIETLKKYRSLMSDLIQQHSGRVVDNPGDNLLAEFSSAVDAVGCSVQIQNRLKKENAKFVEGKRLEFRIGVNIGDVVHDGDRIYGEGVNIAARIESLADAGGISISRNTYDQIKNKLELETEYLGEHGLKNIKEPVRVYKVMMGTDTPKALLEEQLELPAKPSIAVLPFDNMSGDPGQEYIADGISESIISTLSKCWGLFVIARNSTFVYKDMPTKVQQVAEDLGVRYVLEGSVLKAGNRVRIIVQLIDALSGHHIWSDQYDRELNDFFDLLDEITKRIVIELQGEITDGDGARILQKTTNNFKAWGYYVRAWEPYYSMTKNGYLKAEQLLSKSIETDPENYAAVALLSFVHIQKIWSGNSDSAIEDLNRANILLNRCDNKKTTSHFVHIGRAILYLVNKEYKKAIESAKEAIFLCPNDPYSQIALAVSKYYYGEFDQALSFALKANRLTPYTNTSVLMILGWSFRETGQYEKALEIFRALYKRAQMNEFDIMTSHNYLASTNAMMGNIEQAKYHASEILKINPNHSLDYNRNTTFHRDAGNLEPILDALRTAGIPEHSSE